MVRRIQSDTFTPLFHSDAVCLMRAIPGSLLTPDWLVNIGDASTSLCRVTSGFGVNIVKCSDRSYFYNAECDSLTTRTCLRVRKRNNRALGASDVFGPVFGL